MAARALLCGLVIAAAALIWEGLSMAYLYIALTVAAIALVGALVWRYGRLEHQIDMTANEKERLRGFRLAGGTDAQFVKQLHLEDERFALDGIMKRHKIGKFAD